jgi:hypothetical protein
MEAVPLAEQPATPTIIETTGVALDDSGQPLPPPALPEEPRTDFYFPPRPRAPSGSTPPPPVQQLPAPSKPPLLTWAMVSAFLLRAWRVLLGVLRALWRGIVAVGRGLRAGGAGMARWSGHHWRQSARPGLRAAWRWLVHDPYAPPREGTGQTLLQGRVLGVYRYYLYQRLLVGVIGSLPLAVIALYFLNALVRSVETGVNDWLFWLQDIAATLTGLFGCLILLRLTSTRITLHSDGIEYKTWFRVVRSRWEEITMLKVEYFRRNERWIVGTGRGAWAFLHRSLLGLPRGRQLAKLITIYARLNSTGTPYWLPAVGRYNQEGGPHGEIHLPQGKPRSARSGKSLA